MIKGTINIFLKSDMCVSDGSVYNSSVDMEVCKDMYGFPYIPAKRLRGCLRECALELADWGSNVKVDDLFGKAGTEGNTLSAVRFGNARLQGYEDLLKEVRENENHPLFHPQNILNHYTYLRTQTALDMNSGAADSTSLRTIRVINHGLTFVSDVEVEAKNDETPETYVNWLESCCDVLKHMGIARTRGLGEVAVSFHKKEMHVASNTVSNGARESLPLDCTCLSYTLELVDPLILKSVNGEEARTMDYIEGGKIQGLVLQAMKKKGKETEEFLKSKALKFSNATISEHGLRFTEVPAYLYSVKNKKREFRNKLYDSEKKREEYDKGEQINAMKHCYVVQDVNGKWHRASVDIEEHYHHRRPEDKAIGRADSKEDMNSDFYQISSVSPGQLFAGYIFGEKEELENIRGLFSDEEYVYLGYGRTSEYGIAKLTFDKNYTAPKAESVTGRDFAVELLAPAIIYSKVAMSSVDCADLLEELSAALDIKISETGRFVNYATIGGFNVTWGKRKPVLDVFGAGTVLTFQTEEVVTIPHSVLRLGERTREGYGEARIFAYNPTDDRYKGEFVDDEGALEASVKLMKVIPGALSGDIAEEAFETFVRSDAAVHAKEYFTKHRSESVKPVINDLTLMNRELMEQRASNESGQMQRTLKEDKEEFKRIAGERYGKDSERKKAKMETANGILNEVLKKTEGIEERFSEHRKLKEFSYLRGSIYCRYMEAFLMHGKYMLHGVGVQNEA